MTTTLYSARLVLAGSLLASCAALACVRRVATTERATAVASKSDAGNAVAFAGVLRGATSQQLHLTNVPDQPRHSITIYETKGTHESTGAAAFLPAGALRTVELIDAIAVVGGTTRGYISVAVGADTVFAKYDGRTVPDPSRVGTDSARSHIIGTMQFVHGAGRYAGITGSGSYDGFAARAGYQFKWEGTYRVSGDAAPARK